MHMANRLPGILFVAALSWAANCAPTTAQSPEWVVRTVYERTAVHMRRGDLTPTADMAFSRDLLDLALEAASAESRRRYREMHPERMSDEEVSAAILAWPPLIERDLATGCRTCRSLRILSVRQAGQHSTTRVLVEARYQLDGAERSSTIELVREDGSWRVDNIVDDGGRRNLREYLATLIARAPPAGPAE